MIFCLALWSLPAKAVAAKGSGRRPPRPVPIHTICADVMRELVSSGTERAKQALVAIPWLRLFLKEAREDDLSRLWGGLLEEHRPPAGQKWKGWLTRTDSETYRFSPLNGVYRLMAELPGDLLQALPRFLSKHLSSDSKAYDLRPVHLLYEWGIRRPVMGISGRISQKRYEPSGVLRFIGSVALYGLAYGRFEDWFKKKVKEREKKGFAEHAAAWQRLIDEDYRFSEIKEALQGGKATPERARELARALNESYALYFRYVEAGYEGDSPEVKRAKLLANPIFSNVRTLVEKGLVREPGFEYGPGAPEDEIPESTVDRLIQVDQLLFAEYQLIPEVVRRGSEYEKLKSKAGFKDIIGYIEGDGFYTRLRGLHDAGKISDDRFTYLLMEDAQWQARFRTFEALDIHRLKIDGKGGFTAERLTLDEIRGETMDEIGRR